MTMWVVKAQLLLVSKGKHIKVLKVEVFVHLKLILFKLHNYQL